MQDLKQILNLAKRNPTSILLSPRAEYLPSFFFRWQYRPSATGISPGRDPQKERQTIPPSRRCARIDPLRGFRQSRRGLIW